MTDPTPEPATEPSASDAREHELSTAYAQGDFAQVRKRARELAADENAPAALREQARDWATRVSVDVVVYAMLAFAFALFCAIVLRYAFP
jgi:hypothetical protein